MSSTQNRNFLSPVWQPLNGLSYTLPRSARKEAGNLFQTSFTGEVETGSRRKKARTKRLINVIGKWPKRTNESKNMARNHQKMKSVITCSASGLERVAEFIVSNKITNRQSELKEMVEEKNPAELPKKALLAAYVQIEKMFSPSGLDDDDDDE